MNIRGKVLLHQDDLDMGKESVEMEVWYIVAFLQGDRNENITCIRANTPQLSTNIK